MRTYVRIVIICVKIPALELRAAFGRRWRGQEVPGALMTSGPGGSRVVGEVTAGGLACGVRPGMPLGGAMGICPEILLAESDPVGATALSEALFRQLEEMGVDLEVGLPGEAFFSSEGLEPLHGGRDSLLQKIRGLVGGQAGIGAGPTRLAAVASTAPPGSDPRPMTTNEMWDGLGSLPLSCLTGRLEGGAGELEEMLRSLERLGVAKLEQLRDLGRDALADRFGEIGLSALDIASGVEPALRPRRPLQQVTASVQLFGQGGIESLQRALALLCSQISESLVRLGKVACSLLLEADLCGGGSWQRSFVPRCPTGDRQLISSILSPSLEFLPGPPVRMGLGVTNVSEAEPEQTVILSDPGYLRESRLDRAAMQVEEALGRPGLMKVVEAEPSSPLPERRLMLVPHISR